MPSVIYPVGPAADKQYLTDHITEGYYELCVSPTLHDISIQNHSPSFLLNQSPSTTAKILELKQPERTKQSGAIKREKQELKEMFHLLTDEQITEVLTSFRYQLEPSIDACLQLSAQLQEAMKMTPTSPVGIKKQPSKDKLCRGQPCILPETFLCPPTFRFVPDSSSSDRAFFVYSIIFRKVRGKLGMTVQGVHGLVVVRALSSPLPDCKGVAERAGVQVGDILTGFDGAYFSENIQVTDVVRQLSRPRDYLTLHFKRALDSDFWKSRSSFHPLVKALLEQKAIGSTQARQCSEAISIVFDRVQSWSTGFILQRDESYHTGSALSTRGVGVAPDVYIPTKGLRPALCIRIITTDFQGDHTVYLISVVDVLSHSKWRVSRRFRAFYELREKLVALRPSIADLPFPSRRLSLSETLSLVNDRQEILEHFLRKVATSPFLPSLHESTARVQLLLQQFLDVPSRIASMELRERSLTALERYRQHIQLHIHNIINIPYIDNIISSFFGRCGRRPDDDRWSGTARALLNTTSQFMDNMQFVLEDALTNELYEVSKDFDTQLSDTEKDSIISTAIRRQVELEVYVPLADVFRAALQRDIHPVQKAVNAYLTLVRDFPQTGFEITVEHLSISSWQTAIDKLQKLKSAFLPYDQLQALVDGATEIPRLHNIEHSDTAHPLGADDFLPIFIYTIVQADIDNLVELKYLLSEFCDPHQRLGELGYYVATFSAAVEHLMRAAMGNESDRGERNTLADGVV